MDQFLVLILLDRPAVLGIVDPSCLQETPLLLAVTLLDFLLPHWPLLLSFLHCSFLSPQPLNVEREHDSDLKTLGFSPQIHCFNTFTCANGF